MFDPVTSRYTDALFGLARSRGVLADVQNDVARLAAELESPGVGSFFFNERIPVEERRSRIQPLVRDMHPLVGNFVNLLFDKRREEVLRDLGPAFRRRVLEESGAAEGVVETARPIDAAEIDRLAGAVGKRLGLTVTLQNHVRPELMGGLRVVVGSRMLDSSYSGRLESLRKRMLDAPLPTSSEA